MSKRFLRKIFFGLLSIWLGLLSAEGTAVPIIGRPCKNCKVVQATDVMTCECKNKNGDWEGASSGNVGDCGAAVFNCDGKLKCFCL